MARPLRFVYPGAIYHVMARGDGGKMIFTTENDYSLFLDWLGKVCESHGWRVHAWVLMGNHFHLLLETPEPNLVSGMRLLLGSYAQAWNRRRSRTGHVFQGRYKSIPVAGERASDASQFRVVADYIHLNPARAGLAGGKNSPLISYRQSSLLSYQKGKGPSWMNFERVLAAFELSKDGRGRRAYVNYLEKRAKESKGKLSPEAMKALRRGWYLGDESFRDRLLALVEESSKTLRRKGSHTAKELLDHSEAEAKSLLKFGLATLGLPSDSKGLQALRKGDDRKVALAILIRTKTNVTNQWVADKLEMGHTGSVSRLIKIGKTDSKVRKHQKNLVKMLKCKD